VAEVDQMLARLGEQSVDPRAFERHRRALGIMLVVGRDKLGRGDDVRQIGGQGIDLGQRPLPLGVQDGSDIRVRW
jgi:hypothetical protein